MPPTDGTRRDDSYSSSNYSCGLDFLRRDIPPDNSDDNRRAFSFLSLAMVILPPPWTTTGTGTRWSSGFVAATIRTARPVAFPAFGGNFAPACPGSLRSADSYRKPHSPRSFVVCDDGTNWPRRRRRQSLTTRGNDTADMTRWTTKRKPSSKPSASNSTHYCSC